MFCILSHYPTSYLQTVQVRPKPSKIITKKTSSHLIPIDDHLDFESPAPNASFNFSGRKSVTFSNQDDDDPNAVSCKDRKPQIHLEEVIKKNALVTLYQGEFGDGLINVMALKTPFSQEGFEVKASVN